MHNIILLTDKLLPQDALFLLNKDKTNHPIFTIFVLLRNLLEQSLETVCPLFLK